MLSVRELVLKRIMLSELSLREFTIVCFKLFNITNWDV